MIVNTFAQGSFYKTVRTPDTYANILGFAGIAEVPQSQDFMAYYHTLDLAGNDLTGNLIKYDFCNDVVFHRSINLSVINDIEILNIRDNEALVAGLYAQQSKSAICRMDKNGDLLESFEITDQSRDITFRISNLEVYDDRYIYISGDAEYDWNSGKIDHSGYLVAKLDMNLNVIWANTYRPNVGNPKKMTVLSTGELIIQKSYNSTIICLNPDGTVKWSKVNHKYSLSDTDPVEVNGGIVFSEVIANPSIDAAFSLVKLDYNGNLVWVSEGIQPIFHGISLTYLKSTDRLMYLTSANFGSMNNFNDVSNVIHEVDASGNITNQVIWQPDNATYAYTQQATSLLDQYALVIGFEGDTATKENRIFLNKFNDLNEITNCSYTDYNYKLPRQSVVYNNILIEVKNIDLKLVIENSLVLDDVATIEHIVCEDTVPIEVDLGPDRFLCKGKNAVLSSNYNYPEYSWSTGANTRSIVVSESGNYWLETGGICSQASDTVNVIVYDTTQPQFIIDPMTGMPGDPFDFTSLNANLNGLSWRINGRTVANDSAFSFTFDSPGRYKVDYYIIDENGCVSTASSYIEINGEPDTTVFTPNPKDSTVIIRFYLPNSFTPNNDGVNDEFGPIGTGIKYYHLSIFDRWGKLLFDENNTTWNGENYREDGYVYKLKVIGDQDEVTEKIGMVYLLR